MSNFTDKLISVAEQNEATKCIISEEKAQILEKLSCGEVFVVRSIKSASKIYFRKRILLSVPIIPLGIVENLRKICLNPLAQTARLLREALQKAFLVLFRKKEHNTIKN